VPDQLPTDSYELDSLDLDVIRLALRGDANTRRYVPEVIRLCGKHQLARPSDAPSPDDSKLAVVAADADGVGDIWTMNANGTDLTRLTHDLGAAETLSWR
jgi:hypothetical protein